MDLLVLDIVLLYRLHAFFVIYSCSSWAHVVKLLCLDHQNSDSLLHNMAYLIISLRLIACVSLHSYISSSPILKLFGACALYFLVINSYNRCVPEHRSPSPRHPPSVAWPLIFCIFISTSYSIFRHWMCSSHCGYNSNLRWILLLGSSYSEYYLNLIKIRLSILDI